MQEAADTEEQEIQETEQGGDREPDGSWKPTTRARELKVNVPVGRARELKVEPAPTPGAELCIRTHKP